MEQEEYPSTVDDSECVQRNRLKRMEVDIICLEKRIESMEKKIANAKKKD